MRVTKHVVLTVDPTATHEWDKVSVREPITYHQPELGKLLAYLHNQPGQYLLKVSIETEVIEKIAPVTE